MIYSVGIDIVDVRRLKRVVMRWGERFTRRVFTEKELQYCMKRIDPYPCLAGRFAAKEAFVKATKAKASVALRDIEVLNEPSGAPVLRYPESVHTVTGPLRSHLSISHEKGYAVAVVVLEVAV